MRRRERLKQEAKEKAKRKEEGKKRWSEWQNAIKITTSATNLSAEPREPTKLRSRSLVVQGQKPTKKGSNKETTDYQSNLNSLTITSRLTKSFVDPHASSGHTFTVDKAGPSNELTVSVPSLNNLQIDSDNSECLDLKIPIPDTDRTNESTRSFLSQLSIGYDTPRRSGGTPNSRKKPPTR